MKNKTKQSKLKHTHTNKQNNNTTKHNKIHTQQTHSENSVWQVPIKFNIYSSWSWNVFFYQELEGRASSDESSSDDEHTWQEEQRRELKKPMKTERQKPNKPKFYEVKEPKEFKAIGPTEAIANKTNR